MTSLSGGRPISSLGGAAAFVNQPGSARISLSSFAPSAPHTHNRCGGWEGVEGMEGVEGELACGFSQTLPKEPACQSVPSSALCHWGPGTSPAWADTSRVQQEPSSEGGGGGRTPNLAVFFWLAGCLGKKTKKPQPGFLILTAQPSQYLLQPQGQACW